MDREFFTCWGKTGLEEYNFWRGQTKRPVDVFLRLINLKGPFIVASVARLPLWVQKRKQALSARKSAKRQKRSSGPGQLTQIELSTHTPMPVTARGGGQGRMHHGGSPDNSTIGVNSV
jgi:hypothetical protein